MSKIKEILLNCQHDLPSRVWIRVSGGRWSDERDSYSLSYGSVLKHPRHSYDSADAAKKAMQKGDVILEAEVVLRYRCDPRLEE